ncbi:MAG: FAD-binding protein [Armatimonadota bacterium]|nr:FAD-binding protein [Armatimonadota bacterium]
MGHPVRQIDADLLIIGGGGAGAKAAIEAHERGVKVVMLVKGFLGRSGCSIFAGNLNWFGPPQDGTTAVHSDEERQRRTMEFLAKYTHYLGDQEYMRRAARFTFDHFYPWLEERGLYILRHDDGSIVIDLPHGTQAWATKMGMSGQVIMDMLRAEIFRRGITVLEETAATSLLTAGGEVVGATALDYRHGELLVVRAKATILATGHSNYLSLRSTGTREGTGAGWVMALRAGCALQNLEMQWFHASDMAWPRSWMRLHLYPNPQPATAHRTRLYNSDGEFFFDGNFLPHNPVPYIMQLKYLVKQVRQGKARFDGGYYTGYRHVEPDVLRKYVYQTQFLEKVGLDPTRDLIENAVTWHMNVGGIRVDGRTMASGIPGLYVAGSVSALVTGGLPNVMYDGHVAALHAADAIQGRALPALDEAVVARDLDRVRRLFRTEPRDGYLPAQVIKQIRTVMWEHMNYIKHEVTMREGLEKLHRIRAEVLPRMRLESLTRRFTYDWMEAVDAEDMLDACELVIRFSLYRRESRGAFFREDYPLTDNIQWLRHVVGRLDGGDLKIETEPVALPYARPAEGKADFFEVDY